VQIGPGNTTGLKHTGLSVVMKDVRLSVCEVGRRLTVILALFGGFFMLLGLSGCKSPEEYRKNADETAYEIIRQKQLEAVGEVEDFTIEKPSDTLRRRLLEGQKLQYSGPWSLGTAQLERPEHWPQDDYPDDMNMIALVPLEQIEEKLTLTLFAALQIGARNSFSYQTQKEEIFRKALGLDLERNEFRNIFTQQVDNLISTDGSGDRTESGTRHSSITGVSRTLEQGATFTGQLAVDLANLLTLGGASSLGLKADASVSIPLLRGSGAHIVTEPLTQAERDVIYAIWEFERYKRIFAVSVASEYLNVLRQLDRVDNQLANYSRLIWLVRRSRRLAEAGDMDIIQVDQAIQRELQARNQWIQARQTYERSLDDFNILLGLPVDANIVLDRGELEELTGVVSSSMIDLRMFDVDPNEETPPADAPIYIRQPSQEGAGPYELELRTAARMALEIRLDLRVAQEKIFDAQRDVIIKADQLGAELTLLGSSSVGARRSVGSATSDDARLRLNEAVHSALLTLDLPIERTAERNDYRDSLILLERAVRDVGLLEDQVKLDIRDGLRSLQSTRESLQIQAAAVKVAERRVSSTDMNLEAGRALMRDSLEAQDSLLSAQNSLTAAVINYRVTELELQRDMGLLKVGQKGLWQEFDPEEMQK